MLKDLLSNPIWSYEILGNTIAKYALAAGMFLVFLSGLTLLRLFVLRALERIIERMSAYLDDTFTRIVASLRPIFFVFLGIYFAAKTVELSKDVQDVLDGILFVWIAYQVITAIQIVIDSWVERKLRQEEEGKGARTATNVVVLIIKVLLWTIGIILILSNFGISVTSLVAGLGIGGIAIAFAAQNLLSDLFSSFSIYADKPFQPGDFIVVGDKKGVVKSVGMKTTRIKALQGEEIIIPNKELTTATIQNFKKLQERRVEFSLGLAYETPNEKLRKVPEIIKGIITSFEVLRFERAHFKAFGDFALIFRNSLFCRIERLFRSYQHTAGDEFQDQGSVRERGDRDGIPDADRVHTRGFGAERPGRRRVPGRILGHTRSSHPRDRACRELGDAICFMDGSCVLWLY